MNDKPVISLFGPGIRTDLWMRLYDSLLNNRVRFELILVGHKQPDFELPENFRFIYSPVKPAQCAEIGSRYALGDLIMPTSDDVVFSNGALDSAYELYRSLNNDKALVSLRYIGDGIDKSWMALFDLNDPSSPLAPICPLLRRDLWRALGGIDRRFIATCWDIDIAMRVYEIGGEGILSKDARAEEFHYGPKLYEEYGKNVDRVSLDSCWVKDGKISKQRLSLVYPFTDDDILTVSQGNKGRWP